MKAEFSEFTYGFSLVNELDRALCCTAVPIFPSLIEEGKDGGGYDAKLLTKKGKILNLQFKLSDWMKVRSAREYKIAGGNLSLPYHRFEITSKRVSRQQELLLVLEDVEPLTFYAAPAFHLNEHINAYWNSSLITQNTVFVKPSSIGELPDLKVHRVCFNAALIQKKRAYFFSDPQEIEILPFKSFSNFVIEQVAEETNTLEHSIGLMREEFTTTIENARARGRDRARASAISDDSGFVEIPELKSRRVDLDRDLTRLEEILSKPVDGRELLRQVALVSAGIFGTQAIAVVVE